MKRAPGGRLGFTLIEILLVVIIVSLLAAVSSVHYGRFVDRARSVEAVQNLAAIRQGEIMYHEQHGRFAEALDNLAIDTLFDIGITPRYFDYKVTLTGPNSFLAVATPKSGSSPELMTVAMNESGQLSFFIPAVAHSGGAAGAGGTGGGSSGFPFGSGPGTGGGIGGGGIGGGGLGSPGGGGSISGGGGGGSISGGIGATGTISGGGGTESSSGGSGGGTATTVPTLTYLNRGSIVWTNWPDVPNPGANILGTFGLDILTQAFNTVAASAASGITTDLANKGIGILFGDEADFPAGDGDRVTIAFFDPLGQGGYPGAPTATPVIKFNPAFADEDPGVLAATLVHEGTHFQQYLDGTLFTGASEIDIEFTAWWNQSAYWQSVRENFAPYDSRLEQARETAYSYAVQGEAALRDYIATIYD